MTQAPKPDAPIFDPASWRLTEKQAQLCTEARELGQSEFAERAFHYDRNATFPTENYQDLHAAGLLGVCIPEAQGGRGADLKTILDAVDLPCLRFFQEQWDAYWCLRITGQKAVRGPFAVWLSGQQVQTHR